MYYLSIIFKRKDVSFMTSKNIDMQVIFNQLTERNKDILIMIAKGMKLAQMEAVHSSGTSK